jgi:O-antigen/teichoic acid export membrane protein
MKLFAFQPRTMMLAAFVSTNIIQTIFGIAMGWLLTPGDFGLLAFTQTVLLIAVLILNSGFPAALAAALVSGDAGRHARLVRGAILANVGLSIGMSALLLLLFVLGPFRPGFETPLIASIVAGTLPFLALIAIARAAGQAREHFGMMALLQVVEVSVKIIAGYGLVRLGYGTAGAVAGNLAGAAAAGAVGLGLLAGPLRIRLVGSIERLSLRAVGSLFGALIGLTLLLNADQIMLKLVSGVERDLIGQYQAAAVLSNSPYFLAAAVLPILFTRTAQLGVLQRTGAAMHEALRLALLVIVPHSLIIAAAPDALLRFSFPKASAAGIELVPILALANCAVTFVAILAVPFNATGNARRPASLIGGLLAAEIAVLWMVVPAWHTLGAAITYVGAAAAAVLMLGGAYRAAIGARLTKATCLWSLRYGAAVVVGMLIYTLMSTSGSYSSLLSAVAGTAGYAGCVLGLRLNRQPAYAASARSGDMQSASSTPHTESAEPIVPELVSQTS